MYYSVHTTLSVSYLFGDFDIRPNELTRTAVPDYNKKRRRINTCAVIN